MRREKQRWNTRDMTLIALMAVLICVCTWICIPSPVPFTLQTLGVFAAVELLGSRRGFWSVAAYLLMGAAGLPVFSGMTGGLGVLLGQTGGYLWGFLAIPLLCQGVTALLGQGKAARISGMLLGLAACYALGTAWFVFVSDAGVADWTVALSVCVLPFVIPDAVKMMLAMMLARTLKHRVRLL